MSKKTYYHVEKPIRNSVEDTGTLRWRVEKDLTKFDTGTDVHCVFVNRNISVTPLSLDMTSRVSLSKLQSSLLEEF